MNSANPRYLNFLSKEITIDCSVSALGEELAHRFFLRTEKRFNDDVSALVYRIQPMNADAASEIPSIGRELQWIRRAPVWGDFRGSTLRFTDGHSLGSVDYVNQTADFWHSEKTLRDPALLIRTMLYLPIVELLRTEGHYYGHGAIVARKDHGLLILGKGGAGKSSLAVALAANGWRLICDDGFIFDSNGNICAFEEEVSISEELLRSLPWSLVGERRDNQKKVRIPISAFPSSAKARSISLSNIAFLEPNKPGVSFFPNDKRSSLFRIFMEDNPLIFAYPPIARRHLSAIRDLIHRAKNPFCLGLERVRPVTANALVSNLPDLPRIVGSITGKYWT